jgi:hypothetical protein
VEEMIQRRLAERSWLEEKEIWPEECGGKTMACDVLPG